MSLIIPSFQGRFPKNCLKLLIAQLAYRFRTATYKEAKAVLLFIDAVNTV